MEEVLVMMSTYNGEKYLNQQLDSILEQEGVKVSILVRDDGSNDDTTNILNLYQKEQKLIWYSGGNLKTAFSFLNVVQRSKELDSEINYFSFADQDDVWLPYKLMEGIKLIKNKEQEQEQDTPILYCGNYEMVDSELNYLGDNNHYSTTKLNEAIFKSNATGCTIVFNKSLRNLLTTYIPKRIIMHDDWSHKVCLAIGGKVIYDDKKLMLYRQHEDNVIGGTVTIKQKIYRQFKSFLIKDTPRSNQLNEIILGFQKIMPPENYQLMRNIAEYKKNSLIKRISLICDGKISFFNKVDKVKFALLIINKKF